MNATATRSPHRGRRSRRSLSYFSPLHSCFAILGVLLVAEGLLAARFWIQLTAAGDPNSFYRSILDITWPLVVFFTETPEGAAERAAAFEAGTVLAAEVYLVAGLALVTLVALLAGVWNATMAGSEVHHGGVRFAGLPAIARTGARIHNTFFLSLAPEQAYRALRMLRMDRFDLDLVLIPADGGCVVAVFAPLRAERQRVSLLGRLRAIRDEYIVNRTLNALTARAASFHPVVASR